MEKGDYEVFVKLNGCFDKALVELRDCYVREIRELRTMYIEAKGRVSELEAEIKILKGEKND